MLCCRRRRVCLKEESEKKFSKVLTTICCCCCSFPLLSVYKSFKTTSSQRKMRVNAQEKLGERDRNKSKGYWIMDFYVIS